MAYKKISGIYKITSPTGRIYIGKSKNLKQRENNYKSSLEKTKSQVRLYNSIVKYGWDLHIFEIIEECEIYNLYCRERYWQDFYEVIGENGLNCILQKCEEHPAEISEKTRKKMSDSMKGDKNPMFGKDWREGKTQEELEQHKINISNAQKGKKASEESKKLMSINSAKYWEGKKGENHPSFGTKLTNEQKKKISDFMLGDGNPHRGKKQSNDTISKRVASSSKPVFNYYTKEKINSAKELSIKINKTVSCIRAQLNKTNSNTIGWVCEEDLNKPLYKNPKKDKFTDEEIRIIDSISLMELYKTNEPLYRRYKKYNKEVPKLKTEWNEYTLKEELLKYGTIKQAYESQPSAYNKAKKEYPHLISHLTTNRMLWTDENVLQGIKKYSSLKELRNNNIKLYNVIHERFRHLLPLYAN
jgi:group I intron endonuclease